MRVFLLFLSFGLACVRPCFGAEGNPFLTQIRGDVLHSLEANASAMSFFEWRASGYTPREIFENVRAFKSPQAWEALCDSLKGLKITDVALFESEIDSASELKCGPELKKSLAAYWASEALQERKSFAAALRRSRESSPLRKNEDEPLSNAGPIPSKTIAVDASAAPILISGELGPNEIAITLDDGPHPTRTARLLSILKTYGVRANYFQVGEMAKAYPAASRKVVLDGHIVGSHSHSHPLLSRAPLAGARQEITQGRSEVVAASGVDTSFFRFPYGASTPALRDYLKELKLASFLWNLDSWDWKNRNVELLFQQIVRELDTKKSGIILFHDIHEQTVLVFPRFLEELKRRGYTTVVFTPK